MSTNMGSLSLQTGPILTAYASSKTMLNAITTQDARRLADTSVLVNAACPGYVATDFTGFTGTRTPEQGAAIAPGSRRCPATDPAAGSSTTPASWRGEHRTETPTPPTLRGSGHGAPSDHVG